MQKELAKELFEKIKLEKTRYINSIVKEGVLESYHLEFKTTQENDYLDRKDLYRSDFKNLAKGISAFGNSDGGVIIWGVSTITADMSARSDYAAGKYPIKGVYIFRYLIEKYSQFSTSPRHEALENEIIKEENEKGAGYLITHIPRSKNRPLQVIYNKNYRYYIRDKNTSIPATNEVIRYILNSD